ncbi:MAG: META domain-containing protein [Flavobacteriaceae bacterium]
MSLKKFNLLFTLTLILFSSCTKSEEAKTIDGNWEVTSIKEMSSFDTPPNFKINLSTLKIAGFSGCNHFFGSISTENNTLSFHGMGGTKMACPDFTVENLFITTIPEVKSFSFNKDLLQFRSENNEVIMTMRPIEEEQK